MILQPNQPQKTSGMFADEDAEAKPNLAKLNSYYTDGDSVDQDVFAEMRSNLLLVSGEHYNYKKAQFYRRLRDNRELSQEQKLRLTKNHIQKICKLYANNIISMNPNVGFMPKDEKSMHDMKVSTMHASVWADAMERYYLQDKFDDWVDSFVQIGEVAVKIFYDPMLGEVKGYEAQTDPETGNPFLNELQEPIADETKPVVSGEFVFEEIYGFNLLRPPECKDIRKAEWLCIRKMVNKPELLRKFKSDEQKQAYISSDQDETYMIFDPMGGGYKKSSNQTMIREYYFRPSLLFPEGYYYITTKSGILMEGTLPGGLFPIIVMPFDKLATTPRGRSPVKTMRPYQAEINRAASKIAEHQITLGDDKLIIQNGSKVSAGASLPGVRTVNVTGTNPTVMAGRSGEQYVGYMNGQITELYQVLMVQEQAEDNTMKMDPYMMLYSSARNKKKFQRYIKRFEKFLIEVVHLYLRLAKLHLTDDAVIWAVGKSEQINLAEFRELPDTNFEIKIEAQADDIETKLGKQLVLNHALQYVGPNMKPEERGMLLRQMPFANFDESFSDLTMDYDTALNDMLQLDRGERPPINQYDNHVYMIRKLSARTRKSDFPFLPPQVQNNYRQKIKLHQDMEAANQLAIQRAEQGFIPTGGYLVTCDFYVKDPSDASGLKTRRARVPYQSMEWLMTQLEAQGNSQQALSDMNSGQLAELANNVSSKLGGMSVLNPGAGMSGIQTVNQPAPRNAMGM